MSPLSVRYFSIFLVIKLVTESQVSGFALRHPKETVLDLANGTLQDKIEPDKAKVVSIETTELPTVIVPIEVTATTSNITSVNVAPTEQTSPPIEQKVTEDSPPPTRTEETTQSSVSSTKKIIKYNQFQRPAADDKVLEELENPNNKDPVDTTSLNVISITSTEQSTSSSSTFSTTISENTTESDTNTTTKSSSVAPATIEEGVTSVRSDVSSSESVNTSTTQSTITSTEVTPETTELTSTESPKEATPHGKKYTTIERKRPSTLPESEPTTTESDLDRAQSAYSQSGITLEQVLGNAASIPSLDKLKNEFLLITSKATDSTLTSALSSLSTDANPVTIPIKEPADIITTDKINAMTFAMLKPENILTSQRAGFIDYSRPVTSTETTVAETSTTAKSTTEFKSSAVTETTKTTTTATTTSSSTTTTQKTPSGVNGAMVSQGLLAEDAINEELMKEEVLNNHIPKTTKGNKEEIKTTSLSPPKSSQFPVPTIPTTTPTNDSPSSTTEDKLSVKPITKMYPVNPNYKPLKKIEVQPAKPFLIDPDDNSWRNESLNSQGIVFKANNSSKTFTEVLKNKTETELNAIPDKGTKETAQELKERLGKIAEMRKTKKNKFGNPMYSDYVESGESTESSTTTRKAESYDKVVTSTSLLSVKPNPASRPTTKGGIQTLKLSEIEDSTTQLPKKELASEHFEEDDEEDFITLPDIDIKKYITTFKSRDREWTRQDKTSKLPVFPSTKTTPQPSQISQFPERKPTIQYFPPRQPQKVNINDYDDGFKIKVDAFMEPKIKTTMTTTPISTTTTEKLKIDQSNNKNTFGTLIDDKFKKNRYNIQNDPNTGIANPEGSYIIKHLRDFINQASRGNDDRDAPYFMTDIPVRGITVNGDVVQNKLKQQEYDDYDNDFRKDVLVKFVENFNQNSDRFKVDFPILYNTSIVHSKDMAASQAYLRRAYEDSVNNINKIRSGFKYDPNCERTVELSPEYELHYFVPEQEEREEREVLDSKTLPPPYKHYRIQQG